MQPNTAIPAPAGTDENGQPYWIVDQHGTEVKITWSQMQQLLWEQSQKATKVNSGGPEAIPQMPVIPSLPEAVAEAQVEQRIERGAEKSPEKKSESSNNVTTQTAQASAPKSAASDNKKSTGPSHIGHSQKLATVDTSDLNSMWQFVQSRKTADPKKPKAADGLATLLTKIIRQILATSSK
jgi:hypothetical protein